MRIRAQKDVSDSYFCLGVQHRTRTILCSSEPNSTFRYTKWSCSASIWDIKIFFLQRQLSIQIQTRNLHRRRIIRIIRTKTLQTGTILLIPATFYVFIPLCHLLHHNLSKFDWKSEEGEQISSLPQLLRGVILFHFRMNADYLCAEFSEKHSFSPGSVTSHHSLVSFVSLPHSFTHQLSLTVRCISPKSFLHFSHLWIWLLSLIISNQQLQNFTFQHISFVIRPVLWIIWWISGNQSW
jgi:hypothetical protein